MEELTAFQFDLLASIGNQGDRSGKATQRDVEATVEMYDGNLNHGRLYPNLNDLAERGYIDKSKYDDRSNCYSLTDEGRDVLAQRVADLERGV